jgi:hypothetical protein
MVSKTILVWEAWAHWYGEVNYEKNIKYVQGRNGVECAMISYYDRCDLQDLYDNKLDALKAAAEYSRKNAHCIDVNQLKNLKRRIRLEEKKQCKM